MVQGKLRPNQRSSSVIDRPIPQSVFRIAPVPMSWILPWLINSILHGVRCTSKPMFSALEALSYLTLLVVLLMLVDGP